MGDSLSQLPLRSAELDNLLGMNGECDLVTSLANGLSARLGDAPEVAVVLGSGWADRADGLLENLERIPLSDFPNWPLPRVSGHSAELRLGTIDGRRVLLCGGRVHSYEGWEARELVRGVRALVRIGVNNILLLNAAGSLRDNRRPGDLMPLADHINLGLPNPLAANQSEDGSATFLDLVDVYDPSWRQAVLAARPELLPGVYAGLPGPSYETPAEVRCLQQMGADAVGMSTIPEALAARAAGATVMAVSMMTNFAAGIEGSRPSHAEVLETAAAHGERAAEVLSATITAAPR